MFYEVSSRRIIIDSKGNDKSVTENFIVSKAALFSEAETAAYIKFAMENDVVAIKRSNITDLVNTELDGEFIYLATIEESELDDNGKVGTSNIVVAIYANSIEEATKNAKDYMNQMINDVSLVGVKKSKFIEVVEYLGDV